MICGTGIKRTKKVLGVALLLVLTFLCPQAWADGVVKSEKGCSLTIDGDFEKGSTVLLYPRGSTSKKAKARARVTSNAGGRTKARVVGDTGVCGSLRGARVVAGPLGRRPGQRGRVLASGGASQLSSQGLQVDVAAETPLKSLNFYKGVLDVDLFPLAFFKKPAWWHTLFGFGLRYNMAITLPAVPVQDGGTLSTTITQSLFYGLARYAYGKGKKWETALLGGYSKLALAHTPSGVTDDAGNPFSPLRKVSFSGPFLGLRQSLRATPTWGLEVEMAMPLGGQATGDLNVPNKESAYTAGGGFLGRFLISYRKKSWVFFGEGSYSSHKATLDGKTPVALSTTALEMALGVGWLL